MRGSGSYLNRDQYAHDGRQWIPPLLRDFGPAAHYVGFRALLFMWVGSSAKLESFIPPDGGLA